MPPRRGTAASSARGLGWVLLALRWRPTSTRFSTPPLQVLDTGSPELREFDVLCADTVSGDMMLLDFHSVVNLALAGPPAEAAVARRPRRR